MRCTRSSARSERIGGAHAGQHRQRETDPAAGGRITPSSSISPKREGASVTNATGVRSGTLHHDAIRPQRARRRRLSPNRLCAALRGDRREAAGTRCARSRREKTRSILRADACAAPEISRARGVGIFAHSERSADRESEIVPADERRKSRAAITSTRSPPPRRHRARSRAAADHAAHARAHRTGAVARRRASVRSLHARQASSSLTVPPPCHHASPFNSLHNSFAACETLPAPSVTIASSGSRRRQNRFDSLIHRARVMRAAMAEGADAFRQRFRRDALNGRPPTPRKYPSTCTRIGLMKGAREIVHQSIGARVAMRLEQHMHVPEAARRGPQQAWRESPWDDGRSRRPR